MFYFGFRIPGKLKQFVFDLHSGKLHREFHHGPDPTDTAPGEVGLLFVSQWELFFFSFSISLEKTLKLLHKLEFPVLNISVKNSEQTR